MHKHRIFNKGEQIFCLLSSFKYPNILIPVRAIVKDYKWHDVNLRYLVKVTMFYDSVDFLKQYLFDMNFYYNLDLKARNFKLKDTGFKTTKEIELRLNQEDQEKYYIVVDSVMTTKTKLNLQELFNKIQYFLISRHFKELKELSTRTFYKGTFRLDSYREFNSRLFHFVGDLFKDDEKGFDWYIKSI